MTKQPTQVEIRRAAFEAHVRECSYCKTVADQALACGAGTVMLARYMRSLVDTSKSSTGLGY